MIDPFVGYHNQYYGRANKAANWALLSRLYLNAETYVGQNKYSESITYSNKILNLDYSLEPVYVNLFKADNHKSAEMIFLFVMKVLTLRLGRYDIPSKQYGTI